MISDELFSFVEKVSRFSLARVVSYFVSLLQGVFKEVLDERTRYLGSVPHDSC